MNNPVGSGDHQLRGRSPTIGWLVGGGEGEVSP